MNRKVWSIVSGSPFRLGITSLVIFTVAFRAWTLSQWSWYFDDWVWMESASNMDFLPYVFQVYNSHLQPGQFLIMWLVTHLAPLNYGWIVFVVAGFAGGVVVVWALALRELFGEQARLFIALVVLALTPCMTAVSLWWSTALNAYSIQLSMGLCLYFLARMLAGGGARAHVGLVASYIGGLFFWEKAAMITVPLVFTVLIVTAGPVRARIWRVVASLWGVALVTLGYIGFYVYAARNLTSIGTGQPLEARSPLDALGFYVHALLNMSLPSLVGGPFSDLDRPDSLFPDSPRLIQALLAALTLVVIALALRYRRSAPLAIGLAATYSLLCWMLVFLTWRYDFFGDTMTQASRYWVDGLPVALLALMFVVTPLRSHGSDDAWRRPMTATNRDRLRATARHAVSVLAVVCLLASVRSWQTMRDDSPEPWVDAVVADMSAVGSASVWDSTGPRAVLGDFVAGDTGRISTMLRPLELPVSYNESTDRLLVVGADGHLRLGQVVGGVGSLSPGPDGECGYAVNTGTTTEVPLSGPAFDFTWGVQVTYFTGGDARLTLRTDTDEVDLEVPKNEAGGLGVRQLVVDGPVSSIELEGVAGADTVCVTEIRVGNVEATDMVPSQLQD
jgi:hypothetical protein